MFKLSKLEKSLAYFTEQYNRLRVLFSDRHLDRPVVIRFAGLSVFVVMLAYTVPRASLPFYHDSLYYWDLGGSFAAGGHFSVINFSDALRGYLFPFLLYLVQFQAELFRMDAKILFSINSAAFFTVVAIFLVPRFFAEVFRYQPGVIGRLAFTCLLFYFWRGYFLYPLTDFPALAAFLVSATLWMRAIRSEIGVYGFVLAGIFAGASLNLRPVYLISSLALLGYSVFACRIYGLRRTLQAIAFQLLGYGLVLLPQVMINRVHFHSNSPFVQATYLDDANLYAVQLFWGLKTQRIDTNIGDNYPASQAVYEDPLTEKVSGLGTKEKNLANYISVIRQHPLDVAISYFRHAFNGIDTFYATPYVRNIFSDHGLLSLINYLIWFLFALSVFHWDPAWLGGDGLFVVSCFLLPVVLAIPTVVEVRFFLPLYILAYGVICYGFNPSQFQSRLTGDLWSNVRLFGLCVLWIAVSFTLSASTIEMLVIR